MTCDRCKRERPVTFTGHGWDSICGQCIVILGLPAPPGRRFWPLAD